MPPTGPRGPAGGLALSDFRCAAASLLREDPLAGTASTVRAYLLVENPGPWGVDALRDSRLPANVLRVLRERTREARVRPLLVRRPARAARPAPGEPVHVFAANADRGAPWLETGTVAAPEELLDLDLEALGRGGSPGLARTDQPMICVCTHGRHDACCAERGRPVAREMAKEHPAHTWEVSHIGGDRFAANVLVLPEGLYYGRVPAEGAADLASRHLRREVDLDLLRGRSSSPFAAQAAEVALRRRLGNTDLDAVRLVSFDRDGDLAEVGLDVQGTGYRVRVRRTSGDAAQLTCRAVRTSPLPELTVEEIR
ncbi:MAG: sucrase ferredoxin, partial [Nocardioidaceae bacterium]